MRRKFLACFGGLLVLTILVVMQQNRTHAVCKLFYEQDLEADAERMTHAVLACWVATGTLPEGLSGLDEADCPTSFRFWRYNRKPGNLPSFNLSIGDYGLCDWEMWVGLDARWIDMPDPAAQAEMLEMLRIIVSRYLTDGDWPEELDQGAGWNYVCPRRVGEFPNETLRGSVSRTGEDGVEHVLEFDPPDLYIDT